MRHIVVTVDPLWKYSLSAHTTSKPVPDEGTKTNCSHRGEEHKEFIQCTVYVQKKV